MSRKGRKFDALNDEYQYYSARLVDLNEVLSDTNRELTGMDEELQPLKRRQNRREFKKNKEFIKDYEARSSLSDDEDLYEVRPRLKTCYKRSRSMKSTLNDSIHDLHRKVRDISFEQEKLADQINLDRCKCGSRCSKQSCKSTSKKSSSDSDSSFEERLENRIEHVYNKIKLKYEKKSANDELKNVIQDFKKTTASLIKDSVNDNEADLEKHK
ncbi:unnamed protein product, partial [Brachionus calyciflorus]